MKFEPVENGILLVDKPAGISSFGVVATARRVLTNYYGRKIKVGHTGTLDPFATGLIILVIGKECKNANAYSKLDKSYDAEITLGKTSSTGDPEGELTDSYSDSQTPDIKNISEILESFTGVIRQTPPKFSAIKIGGQRAYKLARSGSEFIIPDREVTIFSLEIIDYSYPVLSIRTKVSSGTYIRSLAEDIGAKLGTGAYCSALRRTTVGKYSIEDSVKLQDVK